MSLFQRLGEKLGARVLRKQLEGRKEYLALAAGAAVLVAGLVGVPVASEFDLTDSQSVVGLWLILIRMAQRAAFNRTWGGD